MIVRRHRLAALLLLLCGELLLAGWWRWSWTTAPIQTPFDYGTGHSAVVSENWRRHGALRQHFLPDCPLNEIGEIAVLHTMLPQICAGKHAHRSGLGHRPHRGLFHCALCAMFAAYVAGGDRSGERVANSCVSQLERFSWAAA